MEYFILTIQKQFKIRYYSVLISVIWIIWTTTGYNLLSYCLFQQFLNKHHHDCRLLVGWGNKQHKLHSRIITNINTKHSTDPVEIAIILLWNWPICFRAFFFYFVPSFRIIPGCFCENMREYINVYIHCICVYLILYRNWSDNVLPSNSNKTLCKASNC